MNTIPLRLDWLWFLGYDPDSEVPNHSVLSKARMRWGMEAFRSFFERIVWQCVQTGPVDGTKLFMDSSLIEADASNNSVVSRPAFEPYLVKGCRELEARLDEPQEAASETEPPDVPKSGAANRRHVSTTDPYASVVRQGKGGATLKYNIHLAVETSHEVITATEVTTGETNEAQRLLLLVDQHSRNTAQVVVADTEYGTAENDLARHDRGQRAHIPDSKQSQNNTGRREGIFPREVFARNFSLLYEILLSAQTAQHTIQERWDSTLNNMREIRRQVHDNRSLSNERIHADGIEALQGRRVVRDSATGQTGYANLGYSREIEQGLNAREGWARYQEIPLRDLVR
jgi:hypothetical protein